MTQTAHRERGAAAPQERLPGDGELVEVRGQSWVVARVEPAPPSDGRAATLVHLQSVADGRFGDTLSVIWEVEPGRRVLDRGSLPDASTGQYDPPSRLAAFLDAVRWSAVASADVKTLQAPFRSGVAVEPYQLEPVSRAVGAPRVNLLLADDVGLGKTIEAGLVVQELLLRGRAHRVMVICPAGLTLKWHDELKEKFGLEFTIVDAERCARLRRTHGTAANPFRVHPLTIVSLPWLRGTKAQRLLDEVVPTRQETREDGTDRRFFDLLVLDEAHHVAPAAPKQVYAVDSQQTKLIRRLVPHFEHRLFLSATPHNGYPESYTALLELIDNQKFARGVDPDEQARKETVVRRLKSTITNPDGSPRFRTRRTRELPVEYTDTEREIHGVLSSFSDLRRKRMTPKARGGRRAADLVTLLLKKRLFSSPAAFLHTVQVYLSHLDDTRSRSRSAAAEVPEWLEDFPDLVAELDDLGLAEAEDDALTRSTSLTPQEDGEELTLLQQMERWALTHEAAVDSKADALIRELKAICRPDGQFWTNERVVIFTEYRDTQKWLLNLLQQQELTDGGRVAVLHGGLSTDDREDIRLGFQAHPATDEGKVRILLATDAASEGIDLQNHCHRLFNYDIPFNPNKLEQRIGRIDRWGQKTDPEITHFIGAGWENAAAGSYEADLEFLSRIARKIARTEADLGSVNAVIADAVQRRMIGDTTPVDIDNAKPKQIAGRRTGGTVAAEQNVTAQAKRLAEQYQETVDALGLTPANIKRVVDTALTLDHQQPLTPHYNEDMEGLWTVPPLSGTWERATRGLAHKLRPSEQRPVTFTPQVAALGRDDVVLAHLKHPLVALSTRLLTAAVWNADTVGLHRVTAVVTDDPAVETALVSAYARYVLVGNDGTRLHEEILYAGGWFGDTGRFRRWESVRTQGAVLARALTDGAEAAPDLRHAFTDAWSRLEKPLHDSLTARARERGTSLESALASRRTEEENRIRATLDRFEATLRAKLKEEGDDDNEQIALFGTREVTTAEQRQYREDRDRWQARIEGLAAERERELAAIAARYHEPRSHLFPVAVVVVIPAKEASR
ncbi:DISARM system SNF2-like helicase DrmD [Streptomyces pseudovenezuelae]|uniref:DISARM system SNF2-like helicase DrmD n=1 Tax=Streptomyces pseudovenezuelae TaxID=67350 RepID=UPI002E367329|nr:DISARM system SNF2-like helicase DrmD [Streptomyces pseudovenezuelae]